MCGNGNANPQLVNVFLANFSHFVLFASQTLTSATHSRIYYHNTYPAPDLDSYTVQGVIWANVFRILSNISDLHQFADPENTRNSEMSILFFLEWFSELSIED